MLSRVHHKNLVSLVGLCIDHNEEIVVYEYVPNGTLRESLSGICNLFTAYFLSVELHASPRFLSVLQSLFRFILFSKQYLFLELGMSKCSSRTRNVAIERVR